MHETKVIAAYSSDIYMFLLGLNQLSLVLFKLRKYKTIHTCYYLFSSTIPSNGKPSYEGKMNSTEKVLIDVIAVDIIYSHRHILMQNKQFLMELSMLNYSSLKQSSHTNICFTQPMCRKDSGTNFLDLLSSTASCLRF